MDNNVHSTSSNSQAAAQQAQQTNPTGKEHLMLDQPQYEDPDYVPSGKLADKVALITGGDSGIGRAIALLFAKEGANIVINYLDEHKDAEDTQEMILKLNRKCLAIAGDISDPKFCRELVQKATIEFGKINILVNNAATQATKVDITQIPDDQIERTFQTNILSMFYLTKEVVPQMQQGDSIINTASVTAYQGSEHLVDYSSTKGAIVSFARSLSLNLITKGIRVNAVAPGPIWTPLIPSTMPADKVKEFGKDTPMQRPGQPYEVAYSYLFLASKEASYISGQVIHPNGGQVVNG